MARTILLLEPHDDRRTVHSAALRAAGLDVIAVRDSQAARRLLDSALPDAVVAGLHSQTRADHQNVCRQVKRDAHTKDIPVLLRTTNVTEQDVGLATNPGVFVLAAAEHDGAKLVAAIRSGLAAQCAESLGASPRRQDAKRFA